LDHPGLGAERRSSMDLRSGGGSVVAGCEKVVVATLVRFNRSAAALSCRSFSIPWQGGSASTGPKTPQGRVRIAEAQRRRGARSRDSNVPHPGAHSYTVLAPRDGRRPDWRTSITMTV